MEGSTRRSPIRRIRSLSEENRWALLGLAALAILILGMVGFAEVPGQASRATSRDLLYRALQLFVLESGAVRPPVPWQLDVARLGAPAITALATAGLASRIVRELRAVAGRGFGRRRNHVIICGLGKKGRRLASKFASAGQRVIAIEMEGSPRAPSRSGRWLTLRGDATDPETLERAGIKHAERLICVCGSDGTNAQIAVAARQVARKERTTNLPTLLHIANRELMELLAPIQGPGEDLINARLVNVYELGAQAMLDMSPPFRPDDPRGAGLLIVGLGEVGQCLAVKAARDRHKATGQRLRLFVIDLEASKKIEALRVLHPEFKERWDLVPLTRNVTEPVFRNKGCLAGLGGAEGIAAAYICIDDDPLALRTALVMRGALGDAKVPIKVRTAEGKTGLASVLETPARGSRIFQNIYAFGLLDAACTPEVFTVPEGDGGSSKKDVPPPEPVPATASTTRPV